MVLPLDVACLDGKWYFSISLAELCPVIVGESIWFIEEEEKFLAFFKKFIDCLIIGLFRMEDEGLTLS